MNSRQNNDLTLNDRIYHFWQSAPCGAWASQHDFGTKEFFDDIDDWRQKTLGHIEDDLIDYARYHNARVLEIGCGLGCEAMKFVRHGARYVGVDLTAAAVDATKQRFEVFGLVGDVLQCNAAEDGLANRLGQFDLVISLGVMHHWPDLTGFLRNTWQCLSDQGEFIFAVYAKPSWQFALYQAGLSQYEAAEGCPYVQIYDQQQIRDFLSPSFSVTDIAQYGCFMYNVAEYRKGNLVLEPWFDCMPHDLRHAVDQYLGKYFLVRATKQGESYVVSS